MRVFKEFPKEKVCPICGTNENKEATLIAIVGSNENGSLNYRAEVFHVDCIELWYDTDHQIIYQRVKE